MFGEAMDRRLGTLIFCVVSIHMVLFFWGLPKKKIAFLQKKFVVNTHYIHASPLVQERQHSSPKRKKNVTKQVAKSPKKPSQNKGQSVALKKVENNLINIEKKYKEMHKMFLPLPQHMHELHVDRPEEQEITSYFTLLVASLKEMLELPEVGRVKLRLVLLNTGQVQAVQILQTESEINGRYLQNRLLSLQFPPFIEELKKESMYSFILVFHNEA